jgi:hypothetical protein
MYSVSQDHARARQRRLDSKFIEQLASPVKRPPGLSLPTVPRRAGHQEEDGHKLFHPRHLRQHMPPRKMRIFGHSGLHGPDRFINHPLKYGLHHIDGCGSSDIQHPLPPPISALMMLKPMLIDAVSAEGGFKACADTAQRSRK